MRPLFRWMSSRGDSGATCRFVKDLLESTIVVSNSQAWMRHLLGIFLTTALALGLNGCGPEGAGTIKVEPGARERALNPGGDATAKPATSKQAKAKEAEEAAAKKNSKLY